MLLRTCLSILAGYVIFAASAVILFHAANVDPHSPAGTGFELLAIGYGLLFASFGGFAAGRIARRADLVCGTGWVS